MGFMPGQDLYSVVGSVIRDTTDLPSVFERIEQQVKDIDDQKRARKIAEELLEKLQSDEPTRLAARREARWHGKRSLDSLIRKRRQIHEGVNCRLFYGEYRKNGDTYVQCVVKVFEVGSYSSEFVARAHREIEILRKLQGAESQYIVAMLDYGLLAGKPALVMERLNSLATSREFRQQQREWIVRRVLEAARGVQAAHRMNVIHRDIKPENILLSTSESGKTIAKVADFGVGKDWDATLQLTIQGGQKVGTPNYRAPHRNSDTEIADAYSLGAVLCKGVLGEWPVKGRLSKKRNLVDRSITRELHLIMFRSTYYRPIGRLTVAELIEDLEFIVKTHDDGNGRKTARTRLN